MSWFQSLAYHANQLKQRVQGFFAFRWGVNETERVRLLWQARIAKSVCKWDYYGEWDLHIPVCDACFELNHDQLWVDVESEYNNVIDAVCCCCHAAKAARTLRWVCARTEEYAERCDDADF